MKKFAHQYPIRQGILAEPRARCRWRQSGRRYAAPVKIITPKPQKGKVAVNGRHFKGRNSMP